jgi:hypothetical protein
MQHKINYQTLNIQIDSGTKPLPTPAFTDF